MTLPEPPRRRARRLLAVVALSALVSCGNEGAVSSVGTTPAANAVRATSLPTTTDALPTIDVDGYRALLGQLRGTPVVVNFWASWCEPCKREAPLLRDAHGAYGADVQFVGVDILDARADAEGFVRDFALPYPSFFDPSGATRDAIGALGQPVTAFYDREGTLVGKVTGEIGADELDANLRAIAA